MRNRPATWLIAALVFFQLAIGMQWQVAHAMVASQEGQMNGMEAGHCPGNPASGSGADDRRISADPASAPPMQKQAGNKHDCCRSRGCVCHCAQSPVMRYLSVTGIVPSVTLQRPVPDARAPAVRVSEFFRPPIA